LLISTWLFSLNGFAHVISNIYAMLHCILIHCHCSLFFFDINHRNMRIVSIFYKNDSRLLKMQGAGIRPRKSDGRQDSVSSLRRSNGKFSRQIASTLHPAVGMAECTKGVYRPRRPLETAFYRLVKDHNERYEQVSSERYEDRYGSFWPVIRDTVYKYLGCGDLRQSFIQLALSGLRSDVTEDGARRAMPFLPENRGAVGLLAGDRAWGIPWVGSDGDRPGMRL
jgi:hypothetical protein